MNALLGLIRGAVKTVSIPEELEQILCLSACGQSDILKTQKHRRRWIIRIVDDVVDAPNTCVIRKDERHHAIAWKEERDALSDARNKRELHDSGNVSVSDAASQENGEIDLTGYGHVWNGPWGLSQAGPLDRLGEDSIMRDREAGV